MIPWCISSAISAGDAAAPEMRKPRKPADPPRRRAPASRPADRCAWVGTPNTKRGAGLGQPIEQARAARQVVNDQFAAARQRGDQALRARDCGSAGSACRARRARAASRAPSCARWRAACCRCAERPSASPVVPEVKARYMIWFGSPLGGLSSAGPGRSANGASSAGPTRKAQRRKSRSASVGEDVVGRLGIGAVAGLRDHRGGAHPVDQRDDLLDRVVAVQRRAADIAVARTGQQRDRGLDPARQPHRDALAGPHSVARKPAPPAGRRRRPAPRSSAGDPGRAPRRRRASPGCGGRASA